MCENNQYGEYTPTAEVTPGGILARPEAMEIPAWHVDGQDIWEVRGAAFRALELARNGAGPVFLEACTYRYSDHGRGDPIDYRPEGEMEEWKGRDPLKIASRRLADDYGLSRSVLDQIVSEVEEEISRITEAALASPFPEADLRASEFAASDEA